MRSLDSARSSWKYLQQFQSLRHLRDAVRVDVRGSSAIDGLRSACWKTFLLFESLNVAEWQRTLAASRSAYNSLRSHFFRLIDNPEDVGTRVDPLTLDSESSPWTQLNKDAELRAEIQQDVERCMPDEPFFRRPEVQRMLLDILFVFCRLNPDVGFRQGMHEIAAPILWVVENDAIDVGVDSKALGEDATIKAVFDAEYIEHDVFAIFGQVMQSAKAFYISEGPGSIASRSHHVFSELLPRLDPELVKHLENLDIVPQVFLIRWIRLLFGREFEFNGVLTLWDVIFAEDSSLEIVDHICLSMLIRIRWQLLDADYNAALGLLLRYPAQEKEFPAQTFGLDALYLSTHMTPEGGSFIVLKYTNRPLVTGRPNTPPALQRNVTTYAIPNRRRSRLSPPQIPRQPRPIESILQNTAKNLYARGEKLGIGKAVRNAVDEVHKRAQEIREAQIPSSRQSGSDRSFVGLQDMELRNRRLSALLFDAVNELWEYQRLVAEEKTSGGDEPEGTSVEKLSTAIAKVQFVQVCLDEPTLSLPEHENEPPGTSEGRQGDMTQSSDIHSIEKDNPAEGEILATMNDGSRCEAQPTQPRFQPDMLADPSTFEDFGEPDGPPLDFQTPRLEPQKVTLNLPDSTAKQQTTSSQTPLNVKPVRPSLEESPYSFMLGQDDKSNVPTASGSPRRSSRKVHNVSLFGGEERGRKSLEGASSSDPLGEDDTLGREFDMGSLRRAKAMKK